MIIRSTAAETPFEEGNKAVIKKVDGIMEMHIRTKVTRTLKVD
ncbi:MAG: hypothetical protein OIF32_11465 [Campylobacterales bacterium]|nr:hypothetical protein [Campylobacterales bacterium]